jgi:hypothetical protein
MCVNNRKELSLNVEYGYKVVFPGESYATPRDPDAFRGIYFGPKPGFASTNIPYFLGVRYQAVLGPNKEHGFHYYPNLKDAWAVKKLTSKNTRQPCVVVRGRFESIHAEGTDATGYDSDYKRVVRLAEFFTPLNIMRGGGKKKKKEQVEGVR